MRLSAGETTQQWGNRVHTRFNELVQAEGNPKMFGETGYSNGNVVPRGYNLGKSVFPDAVYGIDQAHPEMLFDLKAGFKGIKNGWLTKLASHLPQGLGDIPVFKLGC